MRRQVGPGIIHTRVRVPDYPLNAYVLEMDMKNAYNRVETHQAYNTLGRTELLATAYTREKNLGKKPIAGCNGSFWCVTASGDPAKWMLGSPFGGEVVNDTLFLNTNTSADTWNGGPARASSTLIDVNKKVFVGPHQWYGYMKSDKFDAPQEIIQVNKRCNTGQLTLFNHCIGRNHTFYTVADCDYIYLKLKDGERWRTVDDVKFEVADIRLSANDQVLGDYDACLVGDGDYKTQLERLAVGDEVTLNHYWVSLQEDDKTPIRVENMLEGNAWIMIHGEITERATNETYNTQTYSKCAYGNNAAGDKLYMIIIDMSTHPLYGRSAGCNTTVMANLFKFLVPDLWNLTNNDAGGSAQMMLDGEVINKTTEATPRAVANGMLMYSIAPEEDADIVTSLAFDELHIKSPLYFSIAPKILAYNKYGELIADGLEGVTFTCSESVGSPSADGSKIEVGGEAGMGTITAHYGDVSVEAPIEVVSSEFAIRLKPMILLDTYREYPVEITTTLEGVEYDCDPARFTWTVEDATVAQIENGVLRGLKEGTTKITASLDGRTEETTVKVEVASVPKVVENFSDWTITSTNFTSDATIDAEGNINFDYAGKRGATIKLTKDYTVYSLPSKLLFDLNTTIPLKYVEFDIRSAINSSENLIRPDVDLIEEGDYSIDVLDLFADRTDLINYPVTIKSVEYLIYHGSSGNNGANTIKQTLTTVYDYYDESGINAIPATDSKIVLYPGENGTIMVSTSDIDIVNVDIYDIAGRRALSQKVNIGGSVAQISTSLQPGVYIVKAQGGKTTVTTKLSIK